MEIDKKEELMTQKIGKTGKKFNKKKEEKQYSDTDSSEDDNRADSRSDSDCMIVDPYGFDDTIAVAKLDRQDSDTDDDDIDDDGIMADIPSENTYQSTMAMPGACDLMENGQNLPYVSNCWTDRDDLQTPKQEFTQTWDTHDFFEFDRVFKCSRSEFIYLIKGICFEKRFNIALSGDNSTRTYRLLNFRCSDLVHKRKVKSDKSKLNERCCFYL